ncbi:alginate lyase family protein [Mycobacterium sp. PSTR-4-N]|uniref:alginate lyase family protein n=1 Tax=Mycobacterium sp. PSTR-4-N TaxID=2917745 RepID=UPI001F14B27A|nr:alginate lyase family protein [Mycobacterium sp. PSTR-4-N]MCG7595435.1 heparinase II/III family protein [Mycobacterium sp. PSTR-4-N]
MSSLTWYAGRAATMSPREVLWRARRLGDALVLGDGLRAPAGSASLRGDGDDWEMLRKRFISGTAAPVLLDERRAAHIADTCDVGALIAEADRICDGERSYFGYGPTNVGRFVDWNHDPISGFHWPNLAGNRIDHRVAPSDPKWIWELNRLQHLPLLAQAWLFTGEAFYAETAFAHLDSWLDQNPVGTGIAWRGAFEPGIRAISIALAVQGLRTSPALTTPRYQRLVRMLDATARYCWRARSRFSSANNHLIGELSGMVTVCLLFPEVAVSEGVLARAVTILAREADNLIAPDGSGAEQSVSYQIFAAELLAVVAVLLRLHGMQGAADIVAAIDRGGTYLALLVGADDPDPRYGDDDDSFAVRLGAEPKRTVRQHLGVVGAITGNDSAVRYGVGTLTSAWFADALRTRPPGAEETARAVVGPSGYAQDGGLVVLRSGRRRITMDVGPLGYLSTAAHGHADALAVTVAADGHDLIVDPGTGSFYRNPAVREAHRGTRMHATVCVDGLDQSEPGGPFYWRRRATPTVHSVDVGTGVVDAEHDGYRRLADPVTHRRWLLASPGDPVVLVVDVVTGRSEHDVTVSWPLHPSLGMTPVPAGHLISRGQVPVMGIFYGATATIGLDQVRGDRDTNLGWWSDRLESRTPAWLVGVRTRSVLPVAIASLVYLGDPAPISGPVITCQTTSLTVRWTQGGAARQVSIDTRRPGIRSGELPQRSKR